MDIDSIINRISFLRTKCKLSARALSLAIGKNSGYINRLESNRDFEPSLSTLLDIIAVCNSSFEEFLYYDIDQYVLDAELLKMLKPLKQNIKHALFELVSLNYSIEQIEEQPSKEQIK